MILDDFERFSILDSGLFWLYLFGGNGFETVTNRPELVPPLPILHHLKSVDVHFDFYFIEFAINDKQHIVLYVSYYFGIWTLKYFYVFQMITSLFWKWYLAHVYPRTSTEPVPIQKLTLNP